VKVKADEGEPWRPPVLGSADLKAPVPAGVNNHEKIIWSEPEDLQ
jgi:hypothetical protein